ncbi:MAG TPA: caspase family protein [Rhodospirillaceae bacterium]|nr:caspase family protein [Rhodospirillaceae bacterium]
MRTILALLLILGGVAAARADSVDVQAGNRDALEHMLADCERIYAANDLDAIRHKIDLSHHREGMAAAAVTPPDAIPDDTERKAIRLWIVLRNACVARVTDFLDHAPVPPGADRDAVRRGNAFLLFGMRATGSLAAALEQGRLTFADYAAKRAWLVEEVDAHRADWRQAMMSPDSAGRTRRAAQVEQRFAAFTADFDAAADKPRAPVASVSAVSLSFPRGPDRPDDIAVIIGNGDYTRMGRDIPDVPPAHADAAAMRSYVVEALGIRETNIIFLTDATAAQMQAVFGNDKDHRGRLFDWVKTGRSRVFVYYAGHGAPGGDGGGPFLVPTDAEAGRIGLSAYPLPLLYDNLARLPAEHVTLVLEACFSGMSQAGTLVARASPILITAKGPAPPPKITVIAAAAADQIASWEPDASHGLFTEYFLKAMSGEADKPPYGNGDGNITLEKLDHYLKDNLSYWARRYYGRDQTAEIAAGAKKSDRL